MSLLVDVVFLSRRVTPDATSLQVVYLFTTGPELSTRIAALNWGDGTAGEAIPVIPSTAFTYEMNYLGAVSGPSAPTPTHFLKAIGYFGRKRFALSLRPK